MIRIRFVARPGLLVRQTPKLLSDQHPGYFHPDYFAGPQLPSGLLRRSTRRVLPRTSPHRYHFFAVAGQPQHL